MIKPGCRCIGPSHGPAEIILALDDFEALRLADFEGLYQEQAAERMRISRQTFGRIVEAARQKVAQALIEGKTLSIEGGSVEMRTFKCSPASTLGKSRLARVGPRSAHNARAPTCIGAEEERGRGGAGGTAVVAGGSLNENRRRLRRGAIAPHFGRCACFLVFQVENGQVVGRETRPNTYTAHALGQCDQRARSYARANCAWATGLRPWWLGHGMGWRAAEELLAVASRWRYVGDTMTADEAVKRQLAGELTTGDGFCRCHG